MANKPIPINEALGRFYPGGPLPKRPFRPYGSRKPIVFKDFDQYYEEFFDMIEKDANISKFLGNWLGGELKADFSQAMKAQVSAPSSAKAADIPEEFASDIDEMPGAVGVSINLNPVDWLKKPQKESKKFLGSIIKGTFGFDVESKKWDFTDVDASIEKDFVWAPLARGERIGNSKLTSGFTQQNALAKALEERLLGKKVEDISSSNFSGTGLSSKETGNLVDYDNNKDSYVIGEGFISEPSNPAGAAQDAFVKGMTTFQAAGSREDGFTNIGTSFLKVLDVESKDVRPIQYNIQDPATYQMLQSRIKDIRGHDTPVLDVFGNDFLSMTARTINGYIEEREDLTDNEIPRLEKEIADLTKDPFKGEEEKKELKAAEKALSDAQKKLPKLNGNIYASVEQLVSPKTVGGTYKGALSTVIDNIKTSGVTDAQMLKLKDSLEVFVDPNTEILKTVSGLRHNLFELDKLDPTDTSTPNQNRIAALNNEIATLQAKFNAHKAVLTPIATDASIPVTALSATTLDLRSVSDIEAGIVGYIDKSIGETREYLKKNADVNSGSFVFRQQTSYLNGVHDFYGSFKDLETTLKKKGFEEAKKGLLESYQGQIDAYKETRNLLMGDPAGTPNPKPGNPAALAEFESIFRDHISALEKLKKSIDTVKNDDGLKDLLRKYKSVYDTATVNGGVGDRTTRRFMESVYFSNGPLAKTFQSEESQDTYEHSKRLYLIARFRYEKEKARDVYSMIKSGPTGVINPLFQRYIKEGQVGGILKPVFKIYKYASRPKDFVKEMILEPTHYFGLIYDDKIAKQCQKDGGFREWINKNIGEKLINSKRWGGLNRLHINLEGMESFTVVANGSFKGAVALGALLKTDGPLQGFTSSMLGALFNAEKLEDLNRPEFAILHGVTLPAEGIKDVRDLLENIQKLKAWFETEEGVAIGKKLGLKFIETLGADGKTKIYKLITDELINNSKAANFFIFLKKLSLDTSSTDPTVMMVGKLRLLSQFLSKVQTGYIAVIANIRKPIVYLKTILTDALTQVAMGYLDSITGGLGEVLRFVVRFVINTAVDWGTKLLSAIARFDLTEFIDEVSSFIAGGIKYLLYFVLAPLIIISMLFDPMGSILMGISPVDNSRTNGVLLEGCGPIEERAQGVGSCGICDAPDSVDWTPYSNYKAAFTEGIAFVLNAAAKDYSIPAPALGAIFYVEGWSENTVEGKFTEDWTKDNVCSWSLNEGPLLPGCEDRTSSSDARGSFQWIPGWFNPQIEASDVASKTPLPRGEYDPCNFLDAAYASAGRFAEMATAAGISGCSGDWLAPIGNKPAGYEDGLPSTAPKIQWAILHYACGANGGECYSETFLDYSRKGLAVFNALKCF